MSKWFNDAVLAVGMTRNFIWPVRGAIVVAAVVGVFSSFVGASAIAEDRYATAAASEQPAAETKAMPDLAGETKSSVSVLVATRQESGSGTPTGEASATEASAIDASATADPNETLEPISEVAERTPDLATTSDETPVDSAKPVAAVSEQRIVTSVEPSVAAPTAASNGENDASEFGAALARVSKAEPAPTTVTKPTAKTAAARESVPYAPAKFQGIEVGKSTESELQTTWGKPAESVSTADGSVLTYDIDPFQSVEVLVTDKVVSAIKIALAANLESQQLAKQLSLDQYESVTVTDDAGEPLGLAFPERGVLFMFDSAAIVVAETGQESAAPSVSHVAIQPLDARAFALRAENRLHGPYQANIRDLNTALALEPELALAHGLLAEIYLATGQADLADAEAAEACELEPTNTAYQLCRTRTMTLLGQYDEAVHQVRAILDREDLSLLNRAQALHEMARLASLGDVQIAAKAIPFDTKAIEIADKLATSKDAKERRAAKELLVNAHLAIAEEIARQAYNNKVESLSMWIGRASGIAEEYIDNDDGSVELRLRVAQSALAALGSFKPTLDPAPWVAEADEASKALFARSGDPLWKQHVQWELGTAYLNALRVEHLRQKTDTAFAYGQLAIENLAEGASSRQAVHSSEQQVGHLYFYMGAVYAVHEQDHEKAVQWFDKAAPLLTGPRPVSELYSPRREGEVLVSMGVTYWQLGQQARALELTQSGANLVELAVEDGILAKSALAVPYGNLASMFEQMGETTNASKYSELADSASRPLVNPRTGRMMGNIRTATIQTNAQQRTMRR
jgi:tetratricopeptide (TPR) repeat protein